MSCLEYKSQMVTIDKSAYDDLCDELRSLSTLAKQFNLTTVRKLNVVADLLKQCGEDRIKVVNRVEHLETLLKSMRIDNGTKEHNNSSQFN